MLTYADICILKQHAGRALVHFESFDKAMDAYFTIAGAPPSVGGLKLLVYEALSY
jgi:hypothetical protein